MGEVRWLKPKELGLTREIQMFENGVRTEAKTGSHSLPVFPYSTERFCFGAASTVLAAEAVF